MTHKGHSVHRLRGIGASGGFAAGPAFVPRVPAWRVKPHRAEDSGSEVSRLKHALEIARHQLESLQQQVSASAGQEIGRIFEFHRVVLEDEELIRSIESAIVAKHCSAEAAVAETLGERALRFEGLADSMLSSRAADVRDVRDRLLALLLGGDSPQVERPSGPVIVIAEDLTPSQMATLDLENTRGICTALGGSLSHAAIIARARGIPTVVGLGEGILSVPGGTAMAVNGDTGVVVLEPASEYLLALSASHGPPSGTSLEALGHAGDPAITLDGRRVRVMANVEDQDSALQSVRHGAEGVGLLRTEFLFLARTMPPDEEEQLAAYRAIAKRLDGRPLVIRTLDVGGDKTLPYLGIQQEPNPSLGLRGIRLCLQRDDIFQPQLRAILRAGADHNVKVMFPMVATRDEILQARAALERAQRNLDAAGVPYASRLDVGIMVETPASAVIADVLASEVDFLSIGSNDLTQYTLACDRRNQRVSHLCDSFHPSVLRQIRSVVAAGKTAGRAVALCGELAGIRRAIPVLVGLGLEELSMSPREIPAAKSLIRRLYWRETRSLAHEVLLFGDADEGGQSADDFLDSSLGSAPK